MGKGDGWVDIRLAKDHSFSLNYGWTMPDLPKDHVVRCAEIHLTEVKK